MLPIVIKVILWSIWRQIEICYNIDYDFQRFQESMRGKDFGLDFIWCMVLNRDSENSIDKVGCSSYRDKNLGMYLKAYNKEFA